MTEKQKSRYEFLAVYPSTKKLFVDQIIQLQAKIGRRISIDEYLLSLLHGTEIQ